MGKSSLTYAPSWSSSAHTALIDKITDKEVAYCSLEFDLFKASVTPFIPIHLLIGLRVDSISRLLNSRVGEIDK